MDYAGRLQIFLHEIVIQGAAEAAGDEFDDIILIEPDDVASLWSTASPERFRRT